MHGKHTSTVPESGEQCGAEIYVYALQETQQNLNWWE